MLLRLPSLGQFVARIGRSIGHQIQIMLEPFTCGGSTAFEKIRGSFDDADLLRQRRGDPDIQRDSVFMCQFFGALK